MNMKDYLTKIIERKKAEAKELEARSDASESIEEVRAIGETLKKLRDEINDAEKALAEIDAQEGADDGEGADPMNDEGRGVGFNPIASYGKANSGEGIDMTDPTNSVEYRSAFMAYVMRGERSNVLNEARSNASTTTATFGAVIPTVLIDRIIEKAESYGMILPRVTKTQYAAGVEIPVSTLKPTASWVAEGATSDRQKYTGAKISFTHHKLRCEVSVSMEVGTMALAAFEAKIVENVAAAIVKAKEQAIISGTGTGQPKGILAETPVDGQAITLTSGTALTYDLLCQAEGALPQAYETNAVWLMTKKNFYAFQAIKDNNGQPVARVNYGINGKAERTLLGREVVLCGDYMGNYAQVPTKNTVFAAMFDLADYCLNSVYEIGIDRKQDWDTEDLLTKAVTACDGKCADKGSLVTLTINKAHID